MTKTKVAKLLSKPERRFRKGRIVFNTQSWEPFPAKVVKYLAKDNTYNGESHGGDGYVVESRDSEDFWYASRVVNWDEWKDYQFLMLNEHAQDRRAEIKATKRPRFKQEE